MNRSGSASPLSSARSELTAVILTYNEAENIADCIESLAWADRIMVFDSFSQDETMEIARKAGVETYQSEFQNYAQQRNAALDTLQTDWVFFVDADERGTPDLERETYQIIASCSENGWYVPRHNYIFGRLTLGAGWFPDYQLRLFRHGLVRYERPVHEIAVVDGAIGYLDNPLLHYNYRDLAHFHAKQQDYSAFDAGILKEKGLKPHFYSFISRPLRHFLWRFVSLNGYRDGLHGLHLSLLMAYYEWVKYRQLAQLWREA